GPSDAVATGQSREEGGGQERHLPGIGVDGRLGPPPRVPSHLESLPRRAGSSGGISVNSNERWKSRHWSIRTTYSRNPARQQPLSAGTFSWSTKVITRRAPNSRASSAIRAIAAGMIPLP